jgi:hypothetical protein
MRIDAAAAAALYDQLPASMRLPTLSPAYVDADASRSDLQPVYWSYQEGHSFWYHGFHLSPLPDVDGFDIQSPYGYGGPISNSEDPCFLGRAWAAYTEAVRSQGVAAEFIRFHPLARNARFYGGRIAEDRLTVWIDLTIPDLLGSYQTRARTAVRKSEKAGVRFYWGENEQIVTHFSDFYRAGMASISATKFYFFEDGYFAEIARMSGTRLAICSLDGEWLAAGLFLHDGNSVEYHLAASSETGKRLSASNLLLHEVALSSQREGYLRLYLGGGTDSQPDNSLLFFKSGFSELRETFSVGTFVHDTSLYEQLRRRWADLYVSNPDKVMFYRSSGSG